MPGPKVLDIAGQAITEKVPGASVESMQNPGQGLATLIGTVLQGVMIIALLMVLYFLTMGAIEWITSAGDKGKLEAARNKMMNAVIGIVILAGTLAMFIVVQYFLNVDVFTFKFSGGSSGESAIQYRCESSATNRCASGSVGANYSLCGVGCNPPNVCCGN
ncbi:hypothetical protein KA082_01655 [Candidatus Woesebacteria bacterium]|nr:hypothetical protein [Candidatus Woesebacteria bacterium]